MGEFTELMESVQMMVLGLEEKKKRSSTWKELRREEEKSEGEDSEDSSERGVRLFRTSRGLDRGEDLS